MCLFVRLCLLFKKQIIASIDCKLEASKQLEKRIVVQKAKSQYRCKKNKAFGTKKERERETKKEKSERERETRSKVREESKEKQASKRLGRSEPEAARVPVFK